MLSIDLLSRGRDPGRPRDDAGLMPGAELSGLLRRSVPELALGLWSLRTVEPLLTVPRGGQRFTACVATWTDHCARADFTAALVVKEDRKRVPRWADRAARVLTASGLGADAASRVAAPYGVCGPGALVSERVEGLSLLATVLAAPGPSAAALAAERLATWLLHLQRSGAALPSSSRRGLQEAVPQLVEVAAAVGTRASGSLLAELAGELTASSEATTVGAALPSHGDLHPANLFLAGACTVAIDLDTVAAREPAYDVGYAVCHLVVSSLLAGAPLEHAVAAAARCWDAYRRGGGVATDERIALQAARALVQSLHFELVTYATGRAEVLELWPRAALLLLQHGRSGLDVLADTSARELGQHEAAS